MLESLAGKQIAAIDLGSGTIKLSIFSISSSLKIIPLELHEIDTRLRLGMGEEMTLKAKPVADTLKAAAALKRRAAEFDPIVLGVYATSAVRRAANPEFLLDPLKEEIRLEAIILSEAEESRLNLLGSQLASKNNLLVSADPGGDSTDCAWGEDWQTAQYSSLPFGSVALMEMFGPQDTNGAIDIDCLENTRRWVYETLKGHESANVFKEKDLLIRMNKPMADAIIALAGIPIKNGQFEAAAAWNTALALANMDHRSRCAALIGEAQGKVDRTCFGYASWAGMMDFFSSKGFQADFWGIKLGAAAAAALKLGPWKESK